MVRQYALLIAVIGMAACQTAPDMASQLPVRLVHGEQLKIWGVDAREEGGDIDVSGQVQRTALPRGPLREHVHLEVLDSAGAVIATEDAALYPFVALREQGGTASLNATTPAAPLADDGKLQLRVVSGVPHD